MLTLEEAQERILAVITSAAAGLPGIEKVPLADALGRVVAADVLAPLDLPLFDNSAMDGYAVRAADVTGASPEKSAALRCVGRVAAGEMFAGEVGAGECVRLFTGSPLPRGADAVVMQEDTQTDPAQSATVRVLDVARPWENVRLRGEDVKRGALLLAAGERLTAGRIGLLAALGFAGITAVRRPVVGLLATGSELRESCAPLGPGEIYESNRALLAPLVRAAGAEARVYPLVPDTAEATRTALDRALAECDAVITSGGVSVGEFDFVKSAFEQLGGTLDLWKVAIKPGKPFVFGRLNGKCLFGLPGNPISGLVTFLLLVRPALLKMQGTRATSLAAHPGVLAEPLVNRGDRRHFMRVKVDEEGRVHLAGMQASHALGALAAANALVEVPLRTTLPAGSAVRVLRWEI
ncbi:MAG: molybdopterin molybdenumtransferase MoeA [Pedosphaera sp.]|nr:molybdopterin molybdenumtransferase MoeA [Pedosphaera sp.]MST01332.1 molybdopterin molybdenumtransferase MoeA [Pedosphaera sp.]